VLTPPPYTLAGTEFPFRALAARVGRAPLGGAREAALAALVGARLADAMIGPAALSTVLRRTRADGGRHWLSSIALSAPVRTAVARLLEATAVDDPHQAAVALTKGIEGTAPHLDRAARLELERLVARLKG